MLDPARHLYHRGVQGVEGPLVFVEDTQKVSLHERVEVQTPEGASRIGRVVALSSSKAGSRAVVEVFQGTDGLSPGETRLRFLGEPILLEVGPGLAGRVFNGVGEPADGGPRITGGTRARVDGAAVNPVRRDVPSEFIETGISAIDAMNSLVRGQKLPIFSGSGLSHDRLAARIARYARLRQGAAGEFAIVFAAIGVTSDTAEAFRREMEDYGALDRMALFLNLASDPAAERLLTPRVALTVAEYLAFEEGRHVLVILTDMTNYCEALREVSASRNETPGRRGYPGYMYSDLAAIYERAGRIRGRAGSVTQIPILTMPGDDITHPIPDLSGYITEGQIVLDRALEQRGLFPPVALLPSLSRLMHHGIGAGRTDADHGAFAAQIYAAYAQARHLRVLSSVVGEEGLSAADRRLLHFGEKLEREFLHQGDERRSLEDSFDLGWRLLAELPNEALVRLSNAQIDKHLKHRRGH
jgi:V/A-type H+-transporting ATPase subunit B